MLVYLVFLLLLVKSDFTSGVKWTKMDNSRIDEPISEYCKDKHCLIKCCPEGQYMRAKKDPSTGQIVFYCDVFNRPNPIIAKRLKSYSEYNKYRWNASSTEITNAMESSKPYFDFIHNDIYTDSEGAYTYSHCDFQILQDGSLNSSCLHQKALQYCVDFQLVRPNSTVDLKLVCRIASVKDKDIEIKQLYIASGMLISSFFLSLVLLVYIALPSLQNIAGKALMAYLVSLIVGFASKATQLIFLTVSTLTREQCRNSSPAVYFFILASFFWLNIMSFDLWWTIRGTCKQRAIHRQGECVKFLWYCLYAWGVPALMTLILVIIDRKIVFTNTMYSPPFETCFAEVISARIYVHVPIGIMTVVNIIMFSMTAYNIWQIKRNVIIVSESRNTKKSENRFVIYIKLFLLMGVGWILEQLPSMHLIPYIIVNFFTMFIGVGIFYVFVCKKSTIKLLFKRLKIRNDYVDGLQTSLYSKSQSVKRFSNRKSHNCTELTTISTGQA